MQHVILYTAVKICFVRFESAIAVFMIKLLTNKHGVQQSWLQYLC